MMMSLTIDFFTDFKQKKYRFFKYNFNIYDETFRK